jgi:hypothetical protein
MQDEREIWMLAQLAANEKDPEKLAALVKEINRLLEEQQDELVKLENSLRDCNDSGIRQVIKDWIEQAKKRLASIKKGPSERRK